LQGQRIFSSFGVGVVKSPSGGDHRDRWRTEFVLEAPIEKRIGKPRSPKLSGEVVEIAKSAGVEDGYEEFCETESEE